MQTRSIRTIGFRPALWVSFLALSLAAPLPADAGPLLSGLVGWWPGEGNANDVQGVSNAQEINGVAYAPGKIGQAFSFDGANDEITVVKTADLYAIKGDFSIEAWIRMTPQPVTPAGDRWIVYMHYCGVPQFQLMVLTNGFRPRIQFRPGTTIVGVTGVTYSMASAEGTKNLNDGAWHHLVGVRSGTTATIYVDGQPEGQNTDAAVLAASWATASWANGGLIDTSKCQYDRIGAIHTGSGHDISISAQPQQKHFPGLIDEVRLFNRALSAAEIATLSKWTSP